MTIPIKITMKITVSFVLSAMGHIGRTAEEMSVLSIEDFESVRNSDSKQSGMSSPDLLASWRKVAPISRYPSSLHDTQELNHNARNHDLFSED